MRAASRGGKWQQTRAPWVGRRGARRVRHAVATGWPAMVVAAVGGLALLLPPGAAAAAAAPAPPLGLLRVPDQGGQPTLPGSPPPAAGRRLPPTPAPSPPQSLAPPAASAVVPPPRSQPPPAKPDPPLPWAQASALVVQLDAGGLALPDAAVRSIGFEGYAPIRAGAVDVGVLTPIGQRWLLGGRLGVAIPAMQARNWWQQDGAPEWIDVRAVFLTFAAEAQRWQAISSRWSWFARGGLGLLVQAGDIKRIETLPGCSDDAKERCPHWRAAGRLASPLGAVLPSWRVGVGVAWSIGAGLQLAADVGIRDLPYAGLGLHWRR